MSNTFEDRLRVNVARSLVTAFARLQNGPTIDYSAGGAPFVSLYGMPRGEASIISADELEIDTDQETRIFEIPLQYSTAGAQTFPPLDGNGNPAILTIDKLRWKSKIYSVQSFTIEASGGLFVLTTLSIRATLVGMPTK